MQNHIIPCNLDHFSKNLILKRSPKTLGISRGPNVWRFSQTARADRRTRPNQGVLDKLTGEISSSSPAKAFDQWSMTNTQTSVWGNKIISLVDKDLFKTTTNPNIQKGKNTRSYEFSGHLENLCCCTVTASDISSSLSLLRERHSLRDMAQSRKG